MLEKGGGSVLHRASVKLKPPPLCNEKGVEAKLFWIGVAGPVFASGARLRRMHFCSV